jgi:hypothetical protein
MPSSNLSVARSSSRCRPGFGSYLKTGRAAPMKRLWTLAALGAVGQIEAAAHLINRDEFQRADRST